MLAIDLYCGLGGWAEGFLSEGYRVKGFDIEKHDYGTGTYPGELFICDVRSLHGSKFADAAVIVASPPCQAYSYRAMPWKRAKALGPPDNTLFNECFRIQREASEAAGHYIPLIVENVKGAQPWVGRACWHYGSFYLWGDVPALMPITFGALKNGENTKWRDNRCNEENCMVPSAVKVPGISFSGYGTPGYKPQGFNVTAAQRFRAEHGVKGFTPNGEPLGKNTLGRKHGSKSKARKAASAHIAKIPFPLAQHIARCFKSSQFEAVHG